MKTIEEWRQLFDTSDHYYDAPNKFIEDVQKDARPQWQPIETAPYEHGRDILVKDAWGKICLVGWCDPTKLGRQIDRMDTAGWYQRSGGEWDLFDSFAGQEIYPTEWCAIP